MSNYEEINADEEEINKYNSINNKESNNFNFNDLKLSIYKEENRPIVSIKPCGVVRGYSVSCYNKDDRKNFDRVSIATNIKINSQEIKKIQNLPYINIFGLYNGYKGKATSEKLRDKLYKLIVNDDEFLVRTDQSIITAFSKIDEELRNEVRESLQLEYSGSSALVCITINDICYISQLGLSKGFISSNHSEYVKNLTRDHGNDERKREALSASTKMKLAELKTARSVGNMHIKQAHATNDHFFNTPDILTFRLTQQEDFIILISDSINEKINNSEILLILYESLIEVIENSYGLEYLYSYCVQQIFKSVLSENPHETVTCLILFFSNFTDLYISKNKEYIQSRIDYINSKPSSTFEEFYNNQENLIRLNNFTNIGLLNKNSSISQKSVKEKEINEGSSRNKNMIINNINNNISITKETKIYCCCFKRKKKTKTAHNVNNNFNNLSSSNNMIV
jgi:serine/threonine protein phosphatase PrpC